MQRNLSRISFFTLSGALIAGTVFLGYVVQRADFPSLIGAYGLFFGLYVYVLLRRDWSERERYWLIGLGVALRVILLFSLPNLSDDFYRFLWDGRLAAHGIHPFAHPPSYFIENQVTVPGLTPELFHKLNSPAYYTVYPPVCQAVFWLAAKVFPESVAGGVFILKLFLFGCELGTIGLLLRIFPPTPKGEYIVGRESPAAQSKSKECAFIEAPVPLFSPLGGWGIASNSRPRSGLTFVESIRYQICRASERPNICGFTRFSMNNIKNVRPLRGLCVIPLVDSTNVKPLRGLELMAMGGGGRLCRSGAAIAYALNPLILLEVVGNCHFEGAMLCFLLAGVYALSRRQVAVAAVWWALATASKLVPLLFLPIVIAWLGWRRGFRFASYFAGVCGLLFLPLLDVQVLRNMADSLNLYFRQFEFNASLYYLLKIAGTAVAPPRMDVARTLGPLLAVAVFLGVAALAMYKRPARKTPDTGYFLPDRLLFALVLYLALATTVHPWYVAPLFGLSLLTTKWFPFVWTATAVLSYSHYAGGGFQEHFGWIAAEYLVVFGALGWDWWSDLRVSGLKV